MAIDTNNMQALLEKAKSGDRGAQFNLGIKFAKGRGVAKDEKAACEWFRQAAEKGHVTAQFNLGRRFAQGRGVAKDEKAAYEWYRKAAKKGHVEAQFNIGWRLAQGRGVPKDEKAACEWYRKAAKKGHVKAQFNLGLGFAQGRGVAKDEKAACEWYRKAAEKGHVEAQFNLGWRLAQGRGIAKKEATYAWWQIAAVQGHEKAKKTLEEFAEFSDIAKDALVVLSGTEVVSASITPALYSIKTAASFYASETDVSNAVSVVKSIINDKIKLQDTITALFWTAYYYDNIDIFEYILKIVENAIKKQGQNQDVHSIQNKHGDNILALAVKGGHKGTVKWLLTQGTYLDMLNNEGQTPISLSSFDRQPHIERCLENAENLIRTAEKAHKGSIESILSGSGTRVNARRIKDGNSALHLAIINKYVPLVEGLLESNADLELLNHDKNSPFKLAEKLYSADKSDESLYIFVLCIFKKLKNLSAARSSSPSVQKASDLEEKSSSEAMHIDNPFEILCDQLLSIIDKLNEPQKSEICSRIGDWFSKDKSLVPEFAYKILMKVEKQSPLYGMANELIRDLIMHGRIIFQKSRIQKNTSGLSLDEEAFEEKWTPVFCDGINVPKDSESREMRYQAVIRHNMLAGSKKDPAVAKFLISYALGEQHGVSGIDGIEGTDPDSLLKLISIMRQRDPQHLENHSEETLNKMVQPVSSQKAAPMEVDQQGDESDEVDRKEQKERKEYKDKADVEMQVESASSSSSSSSSSAMMQFEPTSSASGVSFPLNQFSLGKRKKTDSDDSSNKEKFKKEQLKKDGSKEPPTKKLKSNPL